MFWAPVLVRIIQRYQGRFITTPALTFIALTAFDSGDRPQSNARDVDSILLQTDVGIRLSEREGQRHSLVIVSDSRVESCRSCLARHYRPAAVCLTATARRGQAHAADICQCFLPDVRRPAHADSDINVSLSIR